MNRWHPDTNYLMVLHLFSKLQQVVDLVRDEDRDELVNHLERQPVRESQRQHKEPEDEPDRAGDDAPRQPDKPREPRDGLRCRQLWCLLAFFGRGLFVEVVALGNDLDFLLRHDGNG